MKKPKKPNLPSSVKKPIQSVSTLAGKGAKKLSGRSAQPTEEKLSDALSNVPRITNDTVSEHREEVLSSARKYIYPLQHSKHHVVRISLGLLAVALVAFFAICTLELYKLQNTSSFIYDVTRIVPFPVAKTGGKWVSYESYLFELRRNMHYYQIQQQAVFTTRDGKVQLARLKQQAMNQVIQTSYVKQLADQHAVKVTDQMVNQQLSQVRSQNRLGNNDRVFREVLSEFWGWNENDFKRELKQQILTQAVVAKLDTATNARAQKALQQIKGGADFGAVATQVSDDLSTKATGGKYPDVVTVSDREISPLLTAALFQLKPGQTSDIINTGYALNIVKLFDVSGGKAHAAHIQFNFKGIDAYTKSLRTEHPAKQYIKT